MLPEDVPVALTEDSRRSHIGTLPECQGLTPDDSGHGEPLDDAQAQDQDDQTRGADEPIPTMGIGGKLEAFVEGVDEDQDEDQPRNGIKHINDAHHGVVSSASRGSRNEAVGGADEEADRSSTDTDQQGNSPPFHDSEQEIPSVHVGAAGVCRARRCVCEGARESVRGRKEDRTSEYQKHHASEHEGRQPDRSGEDPHRRHSLILRSRKRYERSTTRLKRMSSTQ